MRVRRLLESWRGSRIPSLRIQSFELVSADRITDLLKKSANILRIALLTAVAYIAIPLVLGFFPVTRGLASAIMPYLMTPVYEQS